jgi:hypothetical protein
MQQRIYAASTPAASGAAASSRCGDTAAAAASTARRKASLLRLTPRLNQLRSTSCVAVQAHSNDGKPATPAGGRGRGGDTSSGGRGGAQARGGGGRGRSSSSGRGGGGGGTRGSDASSSGRDQRQKSDRRPTDTSSGADAAEPAMQPGQDRAPPSPAAAAKKGSGPAAESGGDDSAPATSPSTSSSERKKKPARSGDSRTQNEPWSMPEGFMTVANDGVTPSPAFLQFIEQAVQRSDWRAMRHACYQITDACEEGALRPAHVRVMLAGYARALRRGWRARWRQQLEQQQQGKRERQASRDGDSDAEQPEPSSDSDMRSRPPWWDFRPGLQPLQLMVSEAFRRPPSSADRQTSSSSSSGGRGSSGGSGGGGGRGGGRGGAPPLEESQSVRLAVRFLLRALERLGPPDLLTAASVTSSLVDIGWHAKLGLDEGGRHWARNASRV